MSAAPVAAAAQRETRGRRRIALRCAFHAAQFAKPHRRLTRRQVPLGSKRPGEARQCLVRGHAAGAEATSYEERWYFGTQGDGHSRVADAFGPPAVGQADNEQACITGCFEHTCFARADENGLGDDSDNLLHQQ
jgi:hypothetical protein